MNPLTEEELNEFIVKAASEECGRECKLWATEKLYEALRKHFEGDFWWIKEWLNREEGEYYDDVGGLHSPGNCYNPTGYYCGDCGKKTCATCACRYLVNV